MRVVSASVGPKLACLAKRTASPVIVTVIGTGAGVGTGVGAGAGVPPPPLLALHADNVSTASATPRSRPRADRLTSLSRSA